MLLQCCGNGQIVRLHSSQPPHHAFLCWCSFSWFSVQFSIWTLNQVIKLKGANACQWFHMESFAFIFCFVFFPPSVGFLFCLYFCLKKKKKVELMELNTYLCLNIPDWFYPQTRKPLQCLFPGDEDAFLYHVLYCNCNYCNLTLLWIGAYNKIVLLFYLRKQLIVGHGATFLHRSSTFVDRLRLRTLGKNAESTSVRFKLGHIFAPFAWTGTVVFKIKKTAKNSHPGQLYLLLTIFTSANELLRSRSDKSWCRRLKGTVRQCVLSQYYTILISSLFGRFKHASHLWWTSTHFRFS